ncbi:MAG: hypothetical protein U0527_08265 [Candidatus Eisenbacteria bacterium]
MMVPDHMGLERWLMLRGWRTSWWMPHPVAASVDAEAVRTALQRFKYRGCCATVADDSVYKDENARRILQNYAAAAALRASQALAT